VVANGQKINFGGKPSGRVINLDGESNDEYANRVSELWVQPKKFIRSGQITGLPSNVIEELVAREYDEQQSGHKLKVEKKAKMKARTGKSPDLADAFVILVEVAILNGLLDSEEEKAILGSAHQRFKAARKSFRLQSSGRTTRKLKH
jgi:hypothetical protein